jgi:hypothetical protein
VVARADLSLLGSVERDGANTNDPSDKDPVCSTPSAFCSFSTPTRVQYP